MAAAPAPPVVSAPVASQTVTLRPTPVPAPVAAPAPSPATATPSQSVKAPPNNLYLVQTLQLTIAPGGDITPPGYTSECVPVDYQEGDAVVLRETNGDVLAQTVLGACKRTVVSSIPGVGSITAPRFYLTLPNLPLRADSWTLTVGADTWTVKTADLAAYRWSLGIADRRLTAGS